MYLPLWYLFLPNFDSSISTVQLGPPILLELVKYHGNIFCSHTQFHLKFWYNFHFDHLKYSFL